MNNVIVAAIAGLTLALVLGVWGYDACQERQLRSEVLTLTTTTSELLRAGFKAKTEASSASAPTRAPTKMRYASPGSKAIAGAQNADPNQGEANEHT